MWTDEQHSRLTTLVADGLSAGQIGAELGYTRNAIISRVHRTGLQLRGPANQRHDWTEAETAQLETLAKIMGGKKIARQMGLGESVVRGQAKRCGITLMIDPPGYRIKKRTWLDRVLPPHNEFIESIKHLPPAPRRRVETVEPIEPKHLELFELEPQDCRWPYGDKPFTFCGHQHNVGSSYCSYHDNIACNTA